MASWPLTTVLILALVPLGGARSPLITASLTLLIAAIFVFSAARVAIRDGISALSASLLDGSSPFALVALPLLVTLQAVCQSTIGFSNGPAYVMWQSAVQLSILTAFYLLVRAAAIDHRAVLLLISGLVTIGALESAYGLLNLLSGNEYILTYKRWIHFSSATGTFYSRNQFAYLLEMALPIGVAFTWLFAGDPGSGRPSGGEDRSEERARRFLVTTATATMILALIFSKSRMGIISIVMATGTILGANAWMQPTQHRRSSAAQRLMGPLLAGVVILSFAMVIGIEPVLERFFNIEQDLEQGRWPIWQATSALIAERPLLGHGWGSFQGLIPAYRPRPTGLFYDHAHSDYLEVFAEAGVVGVTVVIALIFLFARRVLRTLALPLTVLQRRTIVAFAIAITSVLLHSIADFGLRVPGIALTFVLVAGVFSRISENPALIDARGGMRSGRSRGGRRT